MRRHIRTNQLIVSALVILSAYHSMIDRQVYYQFVSSLIIENNCAEYKYGDLDPFGEDMVRSLYECLALPGILADDTRRGQQ